MSDFRAISQEIAAELAKVRIIPVLVLNSVEEGVELGRVLLENGLPAAEVTFRTPAAAEAIAAMSKAYPELLVGAGTILNVADLHKAKDAGAKFAVAPGFNPNIVQAAKEIGFPFAPGVCTPSEIEQAYELGCSFLKFFPAEAAGGLKMLKAMAAPYKHLGVRFMPTGGVTTANVQEYLACPEVVAVGGTWLTSSADVAAEVRKAVELSK